MNTEAQPKRRRSSVSPPAVVDAGAVTGSAFRDTSRGEYVYRHLRDAIQDGIYPQGVRIREEEIARTLGVSRTPVREALGRLQAHGLLELATGRGLVVVELSQSQVLELYAMRELLEGSAARLAAQHATPPELTVLDHLLDSFKDHTGDPKRAAHINRVFHRAIYDAAHNRYLLQSLDRMSDALALLPRTTYEIPGRAEAATAEHRAIIDAMRDRAPDAAEEAARRHIREAQKHRMQMLFKI